jgi:hypothetical protein
MRTEEEVFSFYLFIFLSMKTGVVIFSKGGLQARHATQVARIRDFIS